MIGRKILFILGLLFVSINMYGQQSIYENDYTKLMDIRARRGADSYNYNYKLVEFALKYTDTSNHEHYKDVVNLLLENNHFMRKLFGVDSPLYKNVMVCLDRCLLGKYYDIDNYHEYKPKIISAVLELEQLLDSVDNNYLKFINLLSNIYYSDSTYVKKSLKYSKISCNKIAELYTIDSYEYLFAMVQLININNCQHNQKQVKRLISDYLKVIQYKSDDEKLNLIHVLISLLSRLDDQCRMLLLEQYAKLGGRLDGLLNICMNAASDNSLSIIEYIEDNILSYEKDSINIYNFYVTVGSTLGALGENPSDAIVYCKKALDYVDLINRPELAVLNEENLHHVWDLIAINYTRQNDYLNESYSYLNAAKSLSRLTNIDTSWVNESLSLSVYAFSKYYESEEDSVNNSILTEVKNFLVEYRKISNDVKKLYNLYCAIERNNDIKSIQLIEDLVIEKDENIDNIVNFYISIANNFNFNKLYKLAILYYKKAINIAQNNNKYKLLYIENKGHFYHCWFNVAYCQEQLNDYQGMIDSEKKNLEAVSRDIGEFSWETFLLNKWIASSYSLYFPDVKMALKYNKKALDIANHIILNDTINDYKNIIKSIVSEYCNLSQYDSSIFYANKYLKDFAKNASDSALIYNQMGIVYHSSGNFNIADSLFRKSILLTTDSLLKLQYLCNLSQLYHERNQIDSLNKVLENIKEYLLNYNTLTRVDSVFIKNAYYTLALCEFNKNKALYYINQSECYLDIMDQQSYFRHYLNKFKIEDNQYDALLCLQKADSIYKRNLNNPELYGDLLKAYGDYYHSIIDYNRARDYYRLAYHNYMNVISFESKSMLELCHNMAVNYASLLDNKTAYKIWDTIDDIILRKYGCYHPQYVMTLSFMIECGIMTDNDSLISVLLDKYIEITNLIYNKGHECFILRTKAKLAELRKQYELAERYYRKALNISQYLNNTFISTNDINEDLMLLYRKMKSPKLIKYVKKHNEKYIQDVIRNYLFMSESERIRSRNGLYLNVLGLISLGLQDSAIFQDAFDFHLFVKGLLFHTSDEITRILEKDKGVISQVQQISELKDSLNYVIARGDSARTIRFRTMIEESNRKLVNEHVTLSQFQKSMQVSSRDVLNLIGRNGLAIDFVRYIYNDSIYYGAFLCSNKLKEVKFVSICSEELLKSIAIKSGKINYQLYRDKKNKGYVYNLIWQNLLPYMEGYRDIYFMGDGLINQISIEYICDENNVQISDQYRLHRVFHLTDIKKTKDLGGNIVAIGVSDYNSPIDSLSIRDRGTWTNLLGVDKEMGIIADRFNTSSKQYDVTYYLNDNAQEQNIKALNGSPITTLHIATHGFYKNNGALRRAMEDTSSFDHNISCRAMKANLNSLSGLLLRKGNLSWKSSTVDDSNDDILTSEEIENMRFPKLHLTILSACETGLGDVDNEGVWGLQRAFRIAGTESLICSLCKISDVWTARFMDVFYEQIVEGKSIYDAFQKARAYLYKYKRNDPKIWSSLILIE